MVVSGSELSTPGGGKAVVSKGDLSMMLQGLLGSEDVYDILDHLLSIDSSMSTDDVSEYLTSLLGGGSSALSEFVSKLQTYQAMGGTQGEADRALAAPDRSNFSDNAGTKPSSSVLPPEANAESQLSYSIIAPKTTIANQAKPKTRIKISKTGTKVKKTGISVAKVGNIESSSVKKTAKSTSPINPSATGVQKTNATTGNAKPKAKPEPKLPQKGPPPPECGCFGMIHKSLTNCLHCGRIACVQEGYGYCCFCHNLIEDPSHYLNTNGNGNMTPAQRHKERLLKFDRDHAQSATVDRDTINDTNATSIWLNPEERRAAEEQEATRRKALHERPRTMQLQLGNF